MAENIIYTRKHNPTDAEILSFFDLLCEPDQLEWDYEERPSFVAMSAQERLAFYRTQRPGDDRNHGFWQIEGGRVVGMAGIDIFPETCRQHAATLGVGVAKAFQHQGLGYRLVVECIDKARQLGLKRLEADCFAENVAAVALLRSSGFFEEGVRRGAVRKDGRLRDQRAFGLVL